MMRTTILAAVLLFVGCGSQPIMPAQDGNTIECAKNQVVVSNYLIGNFCADKCVTDDDCAQGVACVDVMDAGLRVCDVVSALH